MPRRGGIGSPLIRHEFFIVVLGLLAEWIAGMGSQI
jgi:hypothetical protein